MPFIPVPQTVGFEVLMRLDSQAIENTYYAWLNDDVTAELLEAGANVVLDWVGDFYFPQLSNLVTCVGVKGTDLTTDEGGTFTAVPVSVLGGGVAQPSEPNSVAFVIKHLTGVRGRSGRGRSYVPAIPTTSMTGTNTVNVSFANAMVAAFNELDDALNAIGFVPSVASRFHGGLPRSPGIHIPIINHAYTSLNVKNQRRRGPGVGS